MLKTPVLFLIFNRPDVTSRVFEEIKKQKPKYFYIAADGPRVDRGGEAKLCEQTRKIATSVDWDCEVKTLFRDKNLGCQKAVSEGITWFFDNVGEGIIVEDDCLPHPSFFSFCEAMLEKYRNNEQVMHIAGDVQLHENMTKDSYYFSHIPHIWGWASWRRAWAHYDVEVKDFPEFRKQGKIKNIFKNRYHREDWLKILKMMYNGEIDTWDYQWCYALFNRQGLAICPNKNLITNIGFGENSTHTSEINKFSDKPLSNMDINLKHPEIIAVNQEIQHNVLVERFNMPDEFSIDRHGWLKIAIREINRAIYKACYQVKKLFKEQYSQYCLNKYLKFKKPLTSSVIKDRPEDILYLNTLLGRGGAARITYNMVAKNMQDKNFRTKVLTDAVHGDIDPNDHKLLPRSHRKEQKILNQVQDKHSWLDFFHLSSFDIKNLYCFENTDILHLNNLHGNYFSLFALPELTALKPTVWTLHDEFAYTGHCAFTYECEKWQSGCGNCPCLDEYPGITKDTSSYLLEIKKKIYENSDFTLLCYSQWMKNRVEKSILKDKEVKFIYNGIDEAVFKPLDKTKTKQELGLPTDKKILLFISNGNFDSKQKGGKYLLEAYEHFKDRDDLLFVVLGCEKREYVHHNFLNAEYVYSEADLVRFYNASDLFLFPTLAETFGMVTVEALGCEVPVIAFNTGPVPEIVKHMENGYVTGYKDTNDFIKGIELFLTNEDLYKQASIRARETVLQKFTLTRMIDEYEKMYQEIYLKRKAE